MKDRPMNINRPKSSPIRIVLRCIDDSASTIQKEVISWVKKGDLYTAYSAANMLNGDTICFMIKDMEERKVEPFDGVPAWRADRFEPVLIADSEEADNIKLCLN